MSDTNRFDWASFARWLGDADSEAKVSVLARVAYELTIRARGTYEPGTLGVSDPRRLRILNELMHRVTRRALNLTRGGDGDWKEAEFWQVLCEVSEQGSCLDDLVAATSLAAGKASV